MNLRPKHPCEDWRVLDGGGIALFSHGVPLAVRDEVGAVCRDRAQRDLLRYGWNCQLDEWELGEDNALVCRVRWAEMADEER